MMDSGIEVLADHPQREDRSYPEHEQNDADGITGGRCQ
jgi:hypothetical protein